MNNQISLVNTSRIGMYASAFYLFLMAILNLNLDVIFLTIIFIIISLFLLEGFLKYTYSVQISLIFILLFCIGFYLQLGLIIYDPYIFGYSGFTSLGNFNFEFKQFLEIYTVVIISTIGGLLGLILALMGNTKKLKFAMLNYSNNTKVKKKYITTILILWLIAILTINYFMDFYGIGKHGLENAIVLPNFVAGFLKFIKGFYIIAVSYCLYDLLVKNSTNFHRKLFFCFFILATTYVTYKYSLTKSAIIFQYLPFLILLAFNKTIFFSKKVPPGISPKFIMYFLLFLVLIIFLTGILEQKRAFLYSGTIEEFQFINLLDFMEKIIVRVEGARDVFLVIDYPNKSFQSYLNVNLGNFSPADELYGFSLEGTKFGLTVGFQGLSYLSGSYLVTLFHSLIFILLLTKIEIFFKIRGLFLLSIFVTIILLTLTWMNMDLYTYFRYLVILILITLSCSIIKNLFWINPLRKNKI